MQMNSVKSRTETQQKVKDQTVDQHLVVLKARVIFDSSWKCVFFDSKFDNGDDDESISGRHFEKLHHEVRIILQLHPEKFLEIIGRL